MLYKKAVDDITGLTGAYILVPIGSPYAGYLVRLVVEQPTGAADGFTATLYENYAAAVAAAGGAANFLPPDAGVPPLPTARVAPTRFRVGGVLTAAAAARIVVMDYDSNVGFLTPETANASDRPTQLYLLITPTGGATGKTFHALLVTSSEA
jgi:hypothetical protein